MVAEVLTPVLVLLLAFVAYRSILAWRDAEDRAARAREQVEQLDAKALALAQMLVPMSNACRQLVEQREPTHAEIHAWAVKHGLWIGSLGDMQHKLAGEGWVVISGDRWREIIQQLQPDGPDDQARRDWINRED